MGRSYQVLSTCLISLVLLGTVAVAQQANPTLRVEPAEVTFSSLDSQVTLRVFAGEEPVPASRMTRLDIEGPYDWMFTVSEGQEPGTVLIKTRPHLIEVGTYTLIVEADGQRATVAINAPLDSELSCIEAEAKERNEDILTVKRRHGLVTPARREELTITLPESCYEGTILEIPLEPEPNRYYRWIVNGHVELEGLGASTLRLPLAEPREYLVRVEVSEDNVVVAQWEGPLRVVPEPELTHTARAKLPFKLAAPEGHASYQWTVGGKVVSTERVLKFKFDKPGQYGVECLASSPADDPHRTFRRLVWNVTTP